MTTKIENEKFYRTAIIAREDVDVEARTAELSFSSEEPVERFGYLEVLDHDPKSIRLGRLTDAGPLLVDHDPRDHVGVIENVTVDPKSRKARAVVRFSQSARGQEIFQDVTDGIRRSVSVGYVIHKMEETQGKKGEIPTVRALDWEPLEVSMVAIPADATVGVGRNQTKTEAKEQKMPETIEQPTPAPAATPAQPQIDLVKERADARKGEQERIREISAIGEKFNLRDEANAHIERGAPVEEFRQVVLTQLEAKPMAPPAAHLDLEEKQKKEFSFFRAIEAEVNKNWDLAPFERECSNEIAKRHGKPSKGFYVPYDIPFQLGPKAAGNARDLTAGTDTAGGHMVGTDHMGGEFIDALREMIVLRGMGARFMSGLNGDVAIPALNAKTATAWVGENAAPAEGAPTFRQVTMSPKTVAAYVDISRQLTLQNSPSVEQVIRGDIAHQIASAIDNVGITGGGSNEPTGIIQTAGIGSVALGANGAAPTWASVVNLQTEVAIDNALLGSLSWLTNPKAVGKMRQTVRVASTDSKMIMDGEANSMFGYNVNQSNNVPSNLVKGSSGAICSALIFGDFSQLLIGEWGVLDVLVDPYSLSNQGAVRITTFMSVDVAVRHAESFAAILDMLTT